MKLGFLTTTLTHLGCSYDFFLIVENNREPYHTFLWWRGWVGGTQNLRMMLKKAAIGRPLWDIRGFPAIQSQTAGHQTHRRQVLKIQVLGHQIPAAWISLVWKDFWASRIFFPHTFWMILLPRPIGQLNNNSEI